MNEVEIVAGPRIVDICPHHNTAQGKEIVIKESARPFKNAPDWAMYYVRQLDGREVFYEHQPSIEWQHYYCNTGRQLVVEKPRCYVPNWRRTIRKRP